MSWLEMVLWVGLASLTVALLILMGTRWGQVRPVSKCVALSVFAHVLFVAYAYGTKLNFDATGFGLETTVRVTWNDAEDADFEATDSIDLSQETSDHSENVESDIAPVLESERAPAVTVPARVTDAPALVRTETGAPAASAPALLPEPTSPEEVAASQAAPEKDESPVAPMPDEVKTDPAREAVAQTANPTDSEKPIDPEPKVEAMTANDSPESRRDLGEGRDVDSHTVQIPGETYATASARRLPTVRRPVDDQPVPEPYMLRVAENRLQFSIPFGATHQSEQAVEAALAWLASVQSADGRWDASDYGAGHETKTLGHDRQRAGETADVGITGLALLAFLGAGNNHVQGDYRETVQRGLEFILREQAADGSLAGQARLFEKMYCHGIAGLALSEAYALTGDSRLLPALNRAVSFTVSSQHPTSGGWRYQPGDRGDMSQFGWQVMVLRSSELGGIPIDDRTSDLLRKFLDSAATGRTKGLAGYRAGERATRTMTSEAMACRYFLQTPPNAAAVAEATEFVLQELPGHGQPNLYYWYYATLALYQEQGSAWQIWNDALQKQLLGRQRHEGRLSGSWDTDDVWGGYGGRVYTTSMAALCLEVYYRYLPLYEHTDSSRHAEAPHSLRR